MNENKENKKENIKCGSNGDQKGKETRSVLYKSRIEIEFSIEE